MDSHTNSLELNEDWFFWPSLLSIIFNFSLYYFLQDSDSDDSTNDNNIINDEYL